MHAKKLVHQITEMALSLLIVIGLYLVALHWEPEEEVGTFEEPLVAEKDAFYGAATPTDDPAVCWIVGKGGKILRSADGGKTWSRQESGTGENLQDVAAWDSERAVAVGNDGVILVTRDGGQVWKAAFAPRSDVANKLLRVRIDNSGTAWAVGVMGAVLMSEDFGASWKRAMPEQDVAWNDIAFSDSGDPWVVGEFGNMMRRLRSGESPGDSDEADPLQLAAEGWVAVATPTDRSLMALVFVGANGGMAAGLDGTLITTDDAGETWMEVPLDVDEHIFDLFFVDKRWVGVGSRGLYIESGSTVGAGWQVGQVGPNNFNWHTGVLPYEERLLVIGDTLGYRDGSNWTAFGHN